MSGALGGISNMMLNLSGVVPTSPLPNREKTLECTKESDIYTTDESSNRCAISKGAIVNNCEDKNLNFDTPAVKLTISYSKHKVKQELLLV